MYKEKHEGEYNGGPSYYIEKGFGNTKFSKIYGCTFTVITLISIVILLPGVQANSITISVNNAFGLNVSITDVILVVILALIIFGGIKKNWFCCRIYRSFYGRRIYINGTYNYRS